MHHFTHVLRRAEAQLQAPEPHRSRLLLEIGQDLEDLYHAYRERGCSEVEARARAEAVFGASAEALEQLQTVHAPAYVRLLGRFSSDSRHRLEQIILTLLTVAAVAGGASSLAASELLQTPSTAIWLLLAVLAGAAWLAGAAVLDLYLRPYRPAAPEALLPLAGLAMLSMAIGVLASLLELWRLLGVFASSGTTDLATAIPFLRHTSELLTLALSLALAILLGWFHLRRRAVEIRTLRLSAARLTHPFDEGECR